MLNQIPLYQIPLYQLPHPPFGSGYFAAAEETGCGEEREEEREGVRLLTERASATNRMHQGETTKTTPMASFCGALACIVSRGDRNTRNYCSIIPFLSSEKYYHILNTMWRSRISAKDRRRQPTDQVTYLEGKIREREPIMSGKRRGDEYRIEASWLWLAID